VALYIPAGQRRRRLIIVGVAALVIGLVVGAVVGRSTAPTTADQVSSVRADARQIDARLQALPLEYEKVLAGDAQYANGGGPADSLVVISTDTAALAQRAEWLSDQQRTAVVTAIDQAQQAAAAKVPATEFQGHIDQATATIDETFGLPTSSTTTTGSGS